MSGQPYNKPLDMSAFRNAYLANLQLQILNDDINLKANTTYTKTGAPSQPTDTRTTSEKLSDLYRLRIDVRAALGDIMSGDEAQKVVESLNDTELRFLAQQIGTIVADLKPKYALGVPADIFIPYLQKYITKQTETLGVDYGIQQSTGNEILANTQLIMDSMATSDELRYIYKAVQQFGLQNTALGKQIDANIKQIGTVLDYLPETISTINSAGNSVMRSELLRDLNSLVRDLPTKQQLAQLISQLDRATQQRDLQTTEAILRQIAQITTYQGDLAQELRAVRTQQQEIQQSGGAKAEAIPEAIAVPAPSGSYGFQEYKGENITYINPSLLDNINKTSIKNYIEAMRLVDANAIKSLNLTRTAVSTTLTKPQLVKKLTENDDVIRQIWEQTLPTAMSAPPSVSGKGMKMKGCGVAVPKNMKIDMDAGIKSSPNYVPFGKFLINRHKLADGIVMMKRGNGLPIVEIKTKRISPKLLVVFKRLAGGSMPSFSELENLDDDEREYLKFVSRKSSLSDKLDVPSPKKSKNDELVNQFEIMRGQIIAGNDNKDLIKKFKKTILEMAEKELLPRGQVKDLLMEMARMEC